MGPLMLSLPHEVPIPLMFFTYSPLLVGHVTTACMMLKKQQHVSPIPIGRGLLFLYSFRLYNKVEEIATMQEDSAIASRKNTWQPPPFGPIKVNWDSLLNIPEGCIGLGFIARDCMGAFLGAKSVDLKMMVEPTFAGNINVFPPT
jgi:hypothetical protein